VLLDYICMQFWSLLIGSMILQDMILRDVIAIDSDIHVHFLLFRLLFLHPISHFGSPPLVFLPDLDCCSLHLFKVHSIHIMFPHHLLQSRQAYCTFFWLTPGHGSSRLTSEFQLATFPGMSFSTAFSEHCKMENPKIVSCTEPLIHFLTTSCKCIFFTLTSSLG
jgi:hypothetical protein